MNKKQKITLFIVLFSIISTAVVARMFFLALKHRNPEMSAAMVRGDIFDAAGRALTENCIVYSLAVDKNILSPEDAAATVEELAPLVHMNRSDIARRLSNEKRMYVVLRRKMEPSVRDTVLALQKKGKLKGVYCIPERKRKYPYDKLFAHIIGIAGIENQGLEGVEYAYNAILKPGPASQRRHLQLTVATELQEIVHRELKSAAEITRCEWGMIVVLGASTGDILAADSYPFYDPNAADDVSPSVLRNRVFTSIFEPGSTFKIIAAAYALEKKHVAPGELFTCNGYFEYPDGHRVSCGDKHGRISFDTIIKLSCNAGMINIARRFDKYDYAAYLRTLHFGEKTGVGVAEPKGILRSPATWSVYSRGYLSIGQEIGVTGLQLAAGYAALVNGGFYCTPRLVKSVLRDDLSVEKEFPVSRERVIDGAISLRVKELMTRGVEPGSSGELAALKGVSVMGKTGTSQVADIRAGGYLNDAYNSIFVGALPLENPEVVVLVMLNKPKGAHTGGRVAAPLFKRVALQMVPVLKIANGAVVTVSRAAMSDLSAYARQPDHSSVALERMPDVRGCSLREALSLLAPAVREHAVDVTVAGEGYVRTQNPERGAKLENGMKVHLVLGQP